MAQAIADEWVGGNGLRGAVYEFDLGYVVYRMAGRESAAEGAPRPPDGFGSGRGVIDRAIGKLSLWPSLPFETIVAMYWQQVDVLEDTDG